MRPLTPNNCAICHKKIEMKSWVTVPSSYKNRQACVDIANDMSEKVCGICQAILRTNDPDQVNKMLR